MNELIVNNSRNKLIRKIDYSDRTMTLDLDVTDRLEILKYDMMKMRKAYTDVTFFDNEINRFFEKMFGGFRIRKVSYITPDTLKSFSNDLCENNAKDDVNLICDLDIAFVNFLLNEIDQLIKFKDSEDGSCMKMIQINYIVDDMIISFAFDKFDKYALFDGNRMRLTVV